MALDLGNQHVWKCFFGALNLMQRIKAFYVWMHICSMNSVCKHVCCMSLTLISLKLVHDQMQSDLENIWQLAWWRKALLFTSKDSSFFTEILMTLQYSFTFFYLFLLLKHLILPCPQAALFKNTLVSHSVALVDILLHTETHTLWFIWSHRAAGILICSWNSQHFQNVLLQTYSQFLRTFLL